MRERASEREREREREREKERAKEQTATAPACGRVPFRLLFSGFGFSGVALRVRGLRLWISDFGLRVSMALGAATFINSGCDSSRSGEAGCISVAAGFLVA